MDSSLTPLILDFLEWLAPAPRPYSEVMEAWRTSCPRLTVWEDATDQGLVERKRTDGRELFVELTPRGRQMLSERKPHHMHRTAIEKKKPLIRAVVDKDL